MKDLQKQQRFLIIVLVIVLLTLLIAFLFSLFGYVKLLGKFAEKVYVKTQKDGTYQLIVGKKPFIVKGVCYSPIPVGKNHLHNWWADKSKPWLADGKLMKEAGINTVRFYYPGDVPHQVKNVISDLYINFGVRTAMSHPLGFWEYPHTNYSDPSARERIKQDVLNMVSTYKNTPGILFWILGNEINYSFDGKINPWSSPEIDAIEDPIQKKNERARIYYSFVNDLADQIHKIDPRHPVAMGNGELFSIEIANEVAPDIDIFGCIIYRGKSFGNLFRQLRQRYDKPLVFIEFGCDSFNAHLNKEDQDMQALFLTSLWKEIEKNTSEGTGEKNCLGGLVFEWNDEWWKQNDSDPASWSAHNTEATWSNGSYYFDIQAPNNLNMNEEWWGIVSLSEGLEQGTNARIPKKAYYELQKLWK